MVAASLLLLAPLGCRTVDEPDPTESDADADTDADTDTDVWRDVAIASLQQGVVELGTPIRVTDVVVTGVAPSGTGLFVQESGEAYGGIWVYTQGGGFVFEVGQVVTVTGSVEEYDAEGEWPSSLTEIDSSSEGEVLSEGATDPGFEPVLLSDPSIDLEPYEGVLVRIEDLVVSEGDLPFGEWSASGWTIDDKLFDRGNFYPQDTVESVTGVLDYSYGVYKLQPRSAEDIQGHSSAVIGVDQLSPGQLILSELMIDPGAECNDANDEYLEVFNDSAFWLDLEGLVVSFDDGSTSLERALLAPKSHGLLVRESPSPCYAHSGHAELHLPLTQEGGVASLATPGGTILDSVDTAGWLIESGVAWGFDGQGWCAQVSPLRSDFGTPGQPNDACGVN